MSITVGKRMNGKEVFEPKIVVSKKTICLGVYDTRREAEDIEIDALVLREKGVPAEEILAKVLRGGGVT